MIIGNCGIKTRMVALVLARPELTRIEMLCDESVSVPSTKIRE